jgi:glycosyltransferase involved in cell wall biosynthesis
MKRPRTLIIVEALPFPAYKGGDLRNWQNVNALADIGEVGVFGLCSNDQRRAQTPPGVALWDTSRDPALAYPPPTDRKLAARGWALERMGHPSDVYYSETAAAEINEIMREFRPRVVVIEGLWLHSYITHIRQHHCRIILDAHNIETDLYKQRAQRAKETGLEQWLIRDILPARTAIIEQQATHAVDQIWVCSDADARLLAQLHAPTAPVWVVPNGLDLAAHQTRRERMLPETSDSSIESVIFPGTFAYWPNAAAASFLIKEFFPLLAGASRDYRLLLVGNRPSQAMLQAAREDSRIVVTGTVPDVRPYLAAASVVVVPLFEGGGTRFKILQAFAAGIPVISTAKGAEGLEVIDEVHLLFAESAAEMVAAVRRLSSDKGLRQRLIRNGWELLNLHYSWNAAAARIAAAVGDLCRSTSRSEKGNPSL